MEKDFWKERENYVQQLLFSEHIAVSAKELIISKDISWQIESEAVDFKKNSVINILLPNPTRYSSYSHF